MPTPASDPRPLRLRQQHLLYIGLGAARRLPPPGFRGPIEQIAEESDQLSSPLHGIIQVPPGLVVAGRSSSRNIMSTMSVHYIVIILHYISLG